MHFCVLCRNSRWQQKMTGKRFLVKSAAWLCIYPVDQKLVRNLSVSHCFRDKCIFAFYAEIQDGCPKLQKTIFGKKYHRTFHNSRTCPVVKNCLEITLSRTVSQLNVFLWFMQKFKMAAELWENNFWQKVLHDSADLFHSSTCRSKTAWKSPYINFNRYYVAEM